MKRCRRSSDNLPPPQMNSFPAAVRAIPPGPSAGSSALNEPVPTSNPAPTSNKVPSKQAGDRPVQGDHLVGQRIEPSPCRIALAWFDNDLGWLGAVASMPVLLDNSASQQSACIV